MNPTVLPEGGTRVKSKAFIEIFFLFQVKQLTSGLGREHFW
jgi:hypothetical protein